MWPNLLALLEQERLFRQKVERMNLAWTTENRGLYSG